MMILTLTCNQQQHTSVGLVRRLQEDNGERHHTGRGSGPARGGSGGSGGGPGGQHCRCHAPLIHQGCVCVLFGILFDTAATPAPSAAKTVKLGAEKDGPT